MTRSPSIAVLVLAAATTLCTAQETAAPFFPQLELQALEATRGQPLFTPSRQPPQKRPAPPPAMPVTVAAAAPAYVAPPPSPPEVRLIGIVVEDRSGLAFVEHQPSGEILRLAAGAELDAWTMSIVDARTIQFENGGVRRSYELFKR